MMWLLKMLGFTPTDTAPAWKKKWSTWLQAIQLSLVAVIALYATLPDRMQAVITDTALLWLVGAAILTTFLTVLAANAHQRNMETPVAYKPVTPLPRESPTDQVER